MPDLTVFVSREHMNPVTSDTLTDCMFARAIYDAGAVNVSVGIRVLYLLNDKGDPADLYHMDSVRTSEGDLLGDVIEEWFDNCSKRKIPSWIDRKPFTVVLPDFPETHLVKK